jgi:hypothetical protein
VTWFWRPYYEADAVQFAYTSADIPPRAAVVRPERTTHASLIVSSESRTPLYGLVATSRRPSGAADPTQSSERNL